MKQSPTYPWRRFWCPGDQNPRLDGIGYLKDPEEGSPWGQASNCVPFEMTDHIPCLILLGEPGMGKSTWFASEQPATTDRIEALGDKALWINLHDCVDRSSLMDHVFRLAAIEEWKDSGCRLHLFLDSLDEGMSFNPSLSLTALIAEVRSLPVERLSLRILCRGSEWPVSGEKDLRSVFGSISGKPLSRSETVQVYKLAPLRKKDVTEAVSGAELDPELFLPEVQRRGLVGFVIRPRSLEHLLNVYCGEGAFPANQVELYRKACKLLCEEPNRYRRDGLKDSRLPVEELFTVAKRVAALSLFCGTRGIWTDISSEKPERSLSISDIAWGQESVQGRQLDVSEELVSKTAGTLLFSLRGPHIRDWTHLTDAEFLAAHYLVDRHVPREQILSLIVDPNDPHERIVRQLRHVASWLALMMPDLLEEIVKRDPQVVLLRDLETPFVADSDRIRAMAAGALLDLLDREVFPDDGLLMDDELRRLDHPGLADQLRPYIVDKAKNLMVRRASIRTAEANNLSSLAADIADVALDKEDDYDVRIPAARSVARIGDDENKKRLRSLATDQQDDDPDDELKGYALMALWPDLMTAEDLFRCLTAPKSPIFIGAYTYEFLGHHLMQNLRVEDLPTALRWVRTRTQWEDLSNQLSGPPRWIMDRAYQDLDSPGVLEGLAETAITRMKRHSWIVRVGHGWSTPHPWCEDDRKRRAILEKILDLLSADQDQSRLYYDWLTEILSENDVPGLILRTKTEHNEQVQRLLVFAIRAYFNPIDPDHFRALSEAGGQTSALSNTLRFKVGPILLDSKEAVDQRDLYDRQRPFEMEAEKSRRDQAIKIGRLVKTVCEPESFLPQIMEILVAEIREVSAFRDPTSAQKPALVFLFDFVKVDERRSLERAARQYLDQRRFSLQVWLEKEQIDASLVTGYEALSFLEQSDVGVLDTLPQGCWRKWTPALLVGLEFLDITYLGPLLRSAYSKIPEEFIATMLLVLEKENERDGFPWVSGLLDFFWDEKLGKALLERLRAGNLKPGFMAELLKQLLGHSVPGTEALAKDFLTLPLPQNANHRASAVETAKVLFKRTEDCGWEVIWPAIAGDTHFGRAFVESLGSKGRSDLYKALNRLSEERSAELYIWISREYPQEEPATSHRSMPTGGRHAIPHLRASILNGLAGRGTRKSLDTLQMLAAELPDQSEHLSWTYRAALERFREAAWRPPSIQEFLCLVDDKSKRLISSDEHLMKVVLESLERFQIKLKTRSAVLRSLWDEGSPTESGRFPVPKDESAISDAVKEHLEDDLAGRRIVTNREVQIFVGQETDLRVQATPPPNAREERPYEVIIEVKRCFHAEVMTAMETQLVGKYLAHSQSNHGIYLVGCFHGGRWRDSDDRKSKPNKEISELSKQELLKRLQKQATDLMARSPGLVLKPVVLDTSYGDAPKDKPGKKRKSRGPT